MRKSLLISLFVFASICSTVLAQPGPPGGGEPPPGLRGIRGTVTAVSNTTITVKTSEGETYQILTSENTRIMKQPMPIPGAQSGGPPQLQAPPPREPIKVADIHVGDTVMAGGQVDSKARTVGAIFVGVVDAEQAKKMRENLGKTWSAGEVTAIQNTTITIKRIDNVSQAISVDENTSFRKHRESITLGDIQVGDRLTAQGALKDGVFLASTVNIGRAQGQSGGEGRDQGGGSGNPENQVPGPHNP